MFEEVWGSFFERQALPDSSVPLPSPPTPNLETSFLLPRNAPAPAEPSWHCRSIMQPALAGAVGLMLLPALLLLGQHQQLSSGLGLHSQSLQPNHQLLFEAWTDQPKQPRAPHTQPLQCILWEVLLGRTAPTLRVSSMLDRPCTRKRFVRIYPSWNRCLLAELIRSAACKSE